METDNPPEEINLINVQAPAQVLINAVKEKYLIVNVEKGWHWIRGRVGTNDFQFGSTTTPVSGQYMPVVMMRQGYTIEDLTGDELIELRNCLSFDEYKEVMFEWLRLYQELYQQQLSFEIELHNKGDF